MEYEKQASDAPFPFDSHSTSSQASATPILDMLSDLYNVMAYQQPKYLSIHPPYQQTLPFLPFSSPTIMAQCFRPCRASLRRPES